MFEHEQDDALELIEIELILWKLAIRFLRGVGSFHSLKSSKQTAIFL